MSGKKSALYTALTVIVSLLVVALAAGLIVKYTRVGDTVKDIFDTTYRIEYDGETYTTANNVVAFPREGRAEFKVKGATSYSVTLSPNVTAETDITYEIDNTVYNYSQTDISKVLVGTDSIQNGKFCLVALTDYSLSNVLSKAHNGAAVALNGELSQPYKLSFTADGMTISFLLEDTIRGITLSQTAIYF